MTNKTRSRAHATHGCHPIVNAGPDHTPSIRVPSHLTRWLRRDINHTSALEFKAEHMNLIFYATEIGGQADIFNSRYGETRIQVPEPYRGLFAPGMRYVISIETRGENGGVVVIRHCPGCTKHIPLKGICNFVSHMGAI